MKETYVEDSTLKTSDDVFYSYESTYDQLNRHNTALTYYHNRQKTMHIGNISRSFWLYLRPIFYRNLSDYLENSCAIVHGMSY